MVSCDILLFNGVVEWLHGFWVESLAPTPLPRGRLQPHSPPYCLLCSSCYVFLSGHLLQLSIMLVRLSGIKSSRDPSVSQLLGELLAHPLANAVWAEATVGGCPSLIRDKQKVAVKQYALQLLSARDFIGLLMELNIPKTGFRHIFEFMVTVHVHCGTW